MLDEELPFINVQGVNVAGGSNAQFVVEMTHSLPYETEVRYSATEGTFRYNAALYEHRTGTVVIPPNQTRATISIPTEPVNTDPLYGSYWYYPALSDIRLEVTTNWDHDYASAWVSYPNGYPHPFSPIITATASDSTVQIDLKEFYSSFENYSYGYGYYGNYVSGSVARSNYDGEQVFQRQVG